MRRTFALLAFASCAAVFLVVPSAGAQQGATTATYKRHITKIAAGTNTNCPAGKKKVLVVIGHLAAGQEFVTLRVHYLRLTSGKTLHSLSKIKVGDTKAVWYFDGGNHAKVSSRLRYSYTSFDAQGGATYTGVASKQCFS